MFKMVSSPHTHSGKLTARIMLWVILAMMPAFSRKFIILIWRAASIRISHWYGNHCGIYCNKITR